MFFFFFKQKTAYEMRISDWSSDVCSSDLADDRPEDRAHAPDRHRRAVAFGRIDVEQDRLAHRHERRAENALEQPETHEFAQAGGDAAQPRRDREADDRDLHQPLASESAGEPRSEEHTSELQSLLRISYAVFCLNKKHNTTQILSPNHKNKQVLLHI